jgi:hypothetical protein
MTTPKSRLVRVPSPDWTTVARVTPHLTLGLDRSDCIVLVDDDPPPATRNTVTDVDGLKRALDVAQVLRRARGEDLPHHELCECRAPGKGCLQEPAQDWDSPAQPDELMPFDEQGMG